MYTKEKKEKKKKKKKRKKRKKEKKAVAKNFVALLCFIVSVVD
jgi:hypothetical protein